EQAEEVFALLPRDGPQPWRLDCQLPWIALGAVPDLEHVDLGPVALRHLDPPCDCDAIADIQVDDRLWDRLAVRSFGRDRVGPGDPDAAPVTSPNVEAALRGWMRNEGDRLGSDGTPIGAEPGHGVS